MDDSAVCDGLSLPATQRHTNYRTKDLSARLSSVWKSPSGLSQALIWADLLLFHLHLKWTLHVGRPWGLVHNAATFL